jgi:hypothetical protein
MPDWDQPPHVPGTEALLADRQPRSSGLRDGWGSLNLNTRGPWCSGTCSKRRSTSCGARSATSRRAVMGAI